MSTKISKYVSHACGLKPAIPFLWRLRQEGCLGSRQSGLQGEFHSGQPGLQSKTLSQQFKGEGGKGEGKEKGKKRTVHPGLAYSSRGLVHILFVGSMALEMWLRATSSSTVGERCSGEGREEEESCVV